MGAGSVVVGGRGRGTMAAGHSVAEPLPSPRGPAGRASKRALQVALLTDSEASGSSSQASCLPGLLLTDEST